MSKVCLIVYLALASSAHAYVLVEDLPNLFNNVASEIKNYAQMIEQTINQATQIANQITQIENQVVQLERFGNPNYYVNLLGLGAFMNSVQNLELGVGETMNGYRSGSNGLLALSYTGSGLYDNLLGRIDRYGNPVRFDTGAFRKFGTVNDMLESYNTQQATYNEQLAALQQQLAVAMQNLNADRTQMGSIKYAAQVNAISAQINALGHTTNLAGQRFVAQQTANQNDAARIQEANREQEIQEREEDLQNEANGFQSWIGGTTGNGVLP